MEVKVKEIVGSQLSSRTDGKKMRVYLQKRWDQNDLFIINFEGMEIASVSFIDEAFGHLLEHYTLDEMKNKLKFVGMDEQDRLLLNSIVISRHREKTALES